MKYRIIKDSYDNYLVQRKYKYRPFWFSNTEVNQFGDEMEDWDSSLFSAEKTLEKIKKEHLYNRITKIIDK